MFANQPMLRGRTGNDIGFNPMPFDNHGKMINGITNISPITGSNLPYWGYPTASPMEDISFQTEHFPRTDIYETKDCYQFHMEVPGFSSENIHVSIDGSILTVKGYRSSETESTSIKSKDLHHVLCNERHAKSFVRQFSLTDIVSDKGITATIKNGLLNLVVKKGMNKGAIKVDVRSAR